MKRKQAEELLRKPIESMSLEQLQAHKVKLVDAWRESRAEHGMEQALRDGYYAIVLDGFVDPFPAPKNIWLTRNLADRMDEVYAREAELLASP